MSIGPPNTSPGWPNNGHEHLPPSGHADSCCAIPCELTWLGAEQMADEPKSKPSGVVLRTLTEEERCARAEALADARREAEQRRFAEQQKRR